MRNITSICMVMLIFAINANMAGADVNEEISFTSYAQEPLYLDVAVEDSSGWTYYDAYVEPEACSIANFWVDTYHASFSVCAYGEYSDDFYGCIEGDLSDGYFNIYFEDNGHPYLSEQPWQTCDLYIFDNSYVTSEVYVIEDDPNFHAEAGAGCFIGSLGMF